jgi:hypothetical protein
MLSIIQAKLSSDQERSIITNGGKCESGGARTSGRDEGVLRMMKVIEEQKWQKFDATELDDYLSQRKEHVLN